MTVKDGWITLGGTLDWQHQKDAAARMVRDIDMTGVKGVSIEAAFKRSAEIAGLTSPLKAAQ